MPDYEMPEILRLPLEELCLRIKVYNLGSIIDVLGSALDAPSVKVIKNAISRLREVRKMHIRIVFFFKSFLFLLDTCTQCR
jgi:ATP-dependent RNA helicase DHX29